MQFEDLRILTDYNIRKESIQDGDSEPLQLEVNVGDFVDEMGGTNYGSQFKNLRQLVADVNQQIFGKLMVLQLQVHLVKLQGDFSLCLLIALTGNSFPNLKVSKQRTKPYK